MSKQVGIIKLEGNIGGISFYNSGGQHLARVAKGPSKEQIATQPNFIRTRENNTEFGGSAVGSKACRMALVSTVQTMGDKRMSSRLTKIFRDICSKDTTGIRGQRSITVSANVNELINFEFNKHVSFSSIFNAPFNFSNVTARNAGTVTIPAFLPSSFINAPAGATHFRLIHALGVVSDFKFDVNTKTYQPVNAVLNTLGITVPSAITALASTTPVNFALTATLPGTPTMTPTVVVMQCLGIEFYQHIGTADYLLAKGNCMRIVNVF